MDKPIDFTMARMRKKDPELASQIDSMDQIHVLCQNFAIALAELGSGGVAATFPIGGKHTATVTVEFKENDAV